VPTTQAAEFRIKVWKGLRLPRMKDPCGYMQNALRRTRRWEEMRRTVAHRYDRCGFGKTHEYAYLLMTEKV